MQDEQHWEERTKAFETFVRPLVDPLVTAAQLGDPQQLLRPELVTRVNKAFRYVG